MVKKLICFCSLLIFSLVAARSIEEEHEDEAMMNPELFEGDILGYDPENDRNAVVEKRRLWPGGIIPYVIDQELEYQEGMIEEAMDHYEDETCITFVPRTNEKDYVKIYNGGGCFSNVGRTGNEQRLSLGQNCFKLGIIIHELGHAVGFFHEHSRSDRDDYITIHYENIREGLERQFRKLRPDENRLLTPFDFDSVMLYADDVSSKNGLKTMTAKDGRKWGRVAYKKLSKSDIKRIAKLYKC